MYELTYIVVPFLAGLLATFHRAVGPKLDVRSPRVVAYQMLLGSALLACGALSLREFLSIARSLNTVGHVLFAVILTARAGLGILPWLDQLGSRTIHDAGRVIPFRRRLGSLQAPLGILTILTAVAMLCVRLRIYFAIF